MKLQKVHLMYLKRMSEELLNNGLDHTNQKVGVSITLGNSGSATINLMKMPMTFLDFRDQDLESMKISVAGKDLDPEQYKAEISSGITLEEHKSLTEMTIH